MLQQLVRSIGATAVANWIQPSARFAWQAGSEGHAAFLAVLTPSRFVADFIDRKFGAAIAEAAAMVLGGRPQIRVIVADKPEAVGCFRQAAVGAAAQGLVSDQVVPVEGAALPTAEAAGALDSTGLADATDFTESAGLKNDLAERFASANTTAKRAASGGRKFGLKRSAFRHKLSDYVVCPANELAYGAAKLLAERPDDAPSPLFIHGGCGLGKTHLLQGICRATYQRNPQAKIHYTTGEAFTNAYIQAVTTGKIEAFRAKHRGLDLLAIDDVHFIAGKKKTQGEFYHCIDQLLDGGARIVMASDSHPRDIEAFTEALVSRCIAGLVAEIRPLDTDSLVQLALRFAARRGMRMPHSAAERLANHYGRSARDLEGAITKMHALSQLTAETPNAAPSQAAPMAAPLSGGGGHVMVDRLLAEERGAVPTRPVGFAQLVDAAAEMVGVSSQQVMSKTRVRPVVLARDIAIHLSRQMTAMSYPEIARALGRSNHSTVITAAQRFQKQLAENAELLVPAQPMQTVRLERLVEDVRRQAASPRK